MPIFTTWRLVQTGLVVVLLLQGLPGLKYRPVAIGRDHEVADRDAEHHLRPKSEATEERPPHSTPCSAR